MTRARDERPARFVWELRRLERGRLAQLRRGLGGDERGVHWLEGLYVRSGYGEAGRTDRDALRLLAGLYALKPQARDEGEEAEAPPPAAAEPAPSVGTLMGRLYRAQERRPSTEKRFLALLDADREGLGYHLRQAVTLLATEHLSPDWEGLTGDLLRWGDPVRRRWARDFYREIAHDTKAGDGDGDGDGEADLAPTDPTPSPLPTAPIPDDEGETL